MHEGEYKSIIEVYKQLRKEAVIFPLRDSKNQFLINFNGKKSPIFETIESGHIYEEPNKKLTCKTYRVEELNFTDDFDKPDYMELKKAEYKMEHGYEYHAYEEPQSMLTSFTTSVPKVNKRRTQTYIDLWVR